MRREELFRRNHELFEQQGEQIVFVRIKLTPELRTIFVPRLFVEPALAA